MYSNLAFADWIIVGAAYYCDEENKMFSLQSTRETSSPEMPGNIWGGSWFIDLREGDTNIECNINDTKIETKINVVSPQPRGMCMGIGSVHIYTFKINGQRILNDPPEHKFNSGCGFEPVLHSIDVASEGSSTRVKLCRGIWTWEEGYADSQCEEYNNR